MAIINVSISFDVDCSEEERDEAFVRMKVLKDRFIEQVSDALCLAVGPVIEARAEPVVFLTSDKEKVLKGWTSVQTPQECPHCGSTDLCGEGVDVQVNTSSQEVHCEVCGAQWIEVYTAYDVENVILPKES